MKWNDRGRAGRLTAMIFIVIIGLAGLSCATFTKMFSRQGPWLLIAGKGGMWAFNPDDSGLTHISDVRPFTSIDLAQTTAPKGGHVAFFTADVSAQTEDLYLYTLSLPNAELETVMLLIPPGTTSKEYNDPDNPLTQVEQILISFESLAWSPDGSQLAFMSAAKDSSLDLYVYSTETGEVTQLTDGSSQAMRPSWSPDGIFIVHTSVDSLGTGAGFAMDGIWAARADGREVRSLYPIPEESGDEVVIGWTSKDHFAIYTRNGPCGSSNLRTYDLRSGEIEVLWSGFFSHAVVASEAGAVLVTIDEGIAGCNQENREGTFLYLPGQSEADPVLETGVGWLSWEPAVGLFLAMEDRELTAISPDGEVTRLSDAPGGKPPVLSSDGRFWAFDETTRPDMPGLYAGPFGREALQVFPGSAAYMTWAPENGGLFFIANEDLYFAATPDFTPIPIYEGFGVNGVDSISWVWP